MAALMAKLLPIGLILLMFVVGLRLQPTKLKDVFRHPVALGVGLVVQMVALPLVALGLAMLFALPAPVTAGLMLIAVAPGGVTSNYIALLARADLALSASMTLVTTAMASVTIPLILNLTGVAQLPDGPALLRMSLIMAAVGVGPMLLGMGLAAWRRGFADGLLSWLDPLSRLVFLATVLAVFVQNWEAMQTQFAVAGPATVALNLAALGLAYGAARLSGLTLHQGRAIMVEASLQNVAVSLFVAGVLLKDPSLSIPALIYAVVMNVSALIQIGLSRRGELTAVN